MPRRRSTRRSAASGRSGAKRRPNGRGAPGRRRGRGRLLLRLTFSVLLVLVVAGSAFVYVLWQVPLPPGEPPLIETTFICAADVTSDCNVDNSIAQLSGGEDRVTVGYEQIPPVFILALLATEDREFFRHSGVNPFAVGRALLADLRNEGLRQGGSTITQQYVKNAYLSAERTWERKVKEAVLAVKLERELPKQEILERYLNTIYFGRGAYGIQAAARTYFGKNVEELGLAESAYLAGIIRAPESADANRQPDDPLAAEQRRAAVIRRRAVLDAMVTEEYLTEAERDAIDALPFDYVLPREQATNFGRVARPELGTEYFVDYVQRWLVSSGNFTDAEVFGGGLRVYTTLDFDAQQAAVEAITSTLDRDDDPQASLVAIDHRGFIRAMVGGLDFESSQVNLATGRLGGGSGRQPGSSFKPVVLAAALEDGVSLQTTYNSPSSLTIPGADAGNDWRVANYADAGQGTLNLVDATRVSSNTAYAQLMVDVGPQAVSELASDLGISADVPALPSVVLGTPEVSVLDMATAYSTFANDGVRVGPWAVTRVTDSKGRVLWEAPSTSERVLDENVAKSVNWALSQVVEGGTGTAAKFGQPSAGKTGTTENHRDAWFVGYTCRMTAAVWVGYAGNETRYMTNVHGIRVTGGSFPAEIWRKFMVEATAELESCPFERPTAIPASLESGAGSTVPTSTPPTTEASESTTTTAETPDSTTTTEPPPTTPPPTEPPPSTTVPTTPPPTEPPPTTVAPTTVAPGPG